MTQASQLARQADLRQIRRKLKNIDIAAPLSPLLDSESMGRNTRELNFSLFPTSSLKVVMDKCIASQSPTDLIANLVNRCMVIIEEPDEVKREQFRKEFQTVIFAKFGAYFASKTKNGYYIFALFNRQTFSEISPKLHKDKSDLIMKLLTQPILRLAALRRGELDPNLVMIFAGVDGFRSIMDRFHLDLRLLNAKNIDRLLDRMRGKGVVHYEILRVWFAIWNEEEGVSISQPVVAGSRWTMAKLLAEIERKRSKCMLIELLRSCSEWSRNLVVSHLRARHAITGLARLAWSSAIVDEWMVEARLATHSHSPEPISSGNDIEIPKIIEDADSGEVETIPRIPVKLVSYDKDLAQVKKDLISAPMVGISFVRENLISISTDIHSWVIDLDSVSEPLVRFLLKRILNEEKCVKIVYSLERFLDLLQLRLRMDLIHFENIVDMRRGRIRRRLEFTEKIDHIPGHESLSSLVAEYVGDVHDRSRIYDLEDEWKYRPLREDLVMLCAHDSHYLLKLERRFLEMGFKPVEVLTFDPFSS